MGINDRDYYRDDPPRDGLGGGAGSNSASAIKSLVIVCVVAYFVQLFTKDPDPFGGMHGGLTEWGYLSWESLRRLQIWRVLTYGFLHGNFQHILFNMLGLWLFGRMVEGVIGARETLAFFLVSVIVSGLCQIAVAAGSGNDVHMVGASGGIYALTILAAFYFPRARMSLFMLPISIELRWLAAVYVLMDVTGVMGGSRSLYGGASIAHLAHLGGAAFGACYHNFNWRISGGRFDLTTVWDAPRRAAKAVRDRSTSKETPQVRIYEPPEEEMKERLDAILEKLHREGKASLTPEENTFLEKASERMRNRR